MSSDSRPTLGEIVRFLLVGSLNTLITGSLFLGLSFVVHPSLAFTVAFAVGVAFSLIVTPRIVFIRPASPGMRMRYAAWYGVVFVVGLGLVYVLHDRASLDRVTTTVITTSCIAALNFVGARRVFIPPTSS